MPVINALRMNADNMSETALWIIFGISVAAGLVIVAMLIKDWIDSKR